MYLRRELVIKNIMMILHAPWYLKKLFDPDVKIQFDTFVFITYTPDFTRTNSQKC